MKKLFIMAALFASGLSMISCTAEAVDDVAQVNPGAASADGEPSTVPIKPPPPPPVTP